MAARILILILALLVCCTTALSCGRPTPRRVVERYLEEISRPEFNRERVESYTTERFREKLKQNALLSEIMESGGNYYNLFSPLMSEDDWRIIEEDYDFDVAYEEYSAEKTAQVKVFIRPLPKRGVKEERALASDTLHPLLKQALRERFKLEFRFNMKRIEDEWKVNDIMYTSILDEVKWERSRATVTPPAPDEKGQGDTGGESSGDAGDDS